MKPTRIRMCHSLVMNYGLYKQMEIFVSRGSVAIPSQADTVRGQSQLPSAKCRSSTRMNM